MSAVVAANSAPNGRKVLAPGMKAPWPKGVSGNPSGKAGLFQQTQKLCKEASVSAVEKLIELQKSDDERVAFMAASWVYERAWGKAKDYDPSLERGGMVIDLSRLTPKQLDALQTILASGAIRPADPVDGDGATVIEAQPPVVEEKA